ncbi:MAG: hypothetical protein GY715_03065 [Planctomycetes bacterium]|nr:hypothetical protein [Planctomycetota bacterium]
MSSQPSPFKSASLTSRSFVAVDVGRGGERRGPVGEHAVLVHEQDVGVSSRARERLLAHDDEVVIAVVVEIVPRVVLLLGIRRAERR